MLRLLSSKIQERKDFWKPSKSCHVGIHWIALTEYSQISTHLPGIPSFFSFFCIIFGLTKLATSSTRVNPPPPPRRCRVPLSICICIKYLVLIRGSLSFSLLVYYGQWWHVDSFQQQWILSLLSEKAFVLVLIIQVGICAPKTALLVNPMV